MVELDDIKRVRGVPIENTPQMEYERIMLHASRMYDTSDEVEAGVAFQQAFEWALNELKKRDLA